MNFGRILRAVDAAMTVRDAVRRVRHDEPSYPPEGYAPPPPGAAIANQIESRLSNIVVAALKEAFDRDHARLELERAQLEEQRRRAEEAMRLEVRRQAIDRELNRLRLLAGTALVGWIAAVIVVLARLVTATVASKSIAAVGWVLLLGALGAAFSAQGRLSAVLSDASMPSDATRAGQFALWLLVAGLASSAIALLF